MTGALAETTFNFFGKMKYMKLYDGVIATPVQPFEIALGELGWAMLRGSAYSAAFLVVMVAMDLTSVDPRAGRLPGRGAGRLRLRGARHGDLHLHAQLAGLRPDGLGAVHPLPLLRHLRAGRGLPDGAALAGRGDPAVPVGAPDPRASRWARLAGLAARRALPAGGDWRSACWWLPAEWGGCSTSRWSAAAASGAEVPPGPQLVASSATWRTRRGVSCVMPAPIA